MIWRLREGERLHYGLNWNRDERTHLELIVAWRGWAYIYAAGFRLRRRASGSPMVQWRLRRGCLYCDWRRDITCAKHWSTSYAR